MVFIWVALILLVLLAVADLVVGVTNDAVNFLHAAIGSRVAKRRVIYWIASAGLLIGALLSASMMEVARKGVINPSSFDFTELLVLFVAVMLTDVILIDGFNTFGFPTSTTIAVVFELLGGAMAFSIIKKHESQLLGIDVHPLINTDNVFIILAGIVLSIFLAFVMGLIVQFITRMIFTFNYKSRFKIPFSLIGAAAITAIVFMIAKKVLGGATYIDAHLLTLLNTYFLEVLWGIFAFSTFVFLFVGLSFNVDIARFVVLFGTFALAMSFAANDLVNFIGLPMAGVQSFIAFTRSGISDPNLFSTSFLNNSIERGSSLSEMAYLLIAVLATLVMVLTLFFSKKAQGVTETEIYLGKQSTGYERFEASHLSRIIVRNALTFHASISTILPQPVTNFLKKQYRRAETPESGIDADGQVFFDTLRAAVNLVVASLLISIGTYMRFPLSTTFVVFMVAMGTSLADQAWGRESAVYRVSGVLSILGGWFFTAILAFVGSFIFVYLIYYGGWVMALLIAGGVAWTVVLTTRYFAKNNLEKRALKDAYQENFEASVETMQDSGGEQIRSNLLEASKIYLMAVQGFIDEDVKQLHQAHEKALYLDKLTKSNKEKIFYSFGKMSEEGMEAGQYYIQTYDYLSELVGCMTKITHPLYKHIENNHKGMTKAQRVGMQELLDEVSGFFNHLIHLEKERRFNYLNDLIAKQTFLMAFQDELRRLQIKRIQSGEDRTRVSILFMEILAETKNVLLYSINLIKAHRDFENASPKKRD